MTKCSDEMLGRGSGGMASPPGGPEDARQAQHSSDTLDCTSTAAVALSGKYPNAPWVRSISYTWTWSIHFREFPGPSSKLVMFDKSSVIFTISYHSFCTRFVSYLIVTTVVDHQNT